MSAICLANTGNPGSMILLLRVAQMSVRSKKDPSSLEKHPILDKNPRMNAKQRV
jgi:hypothetical protein